MPLRCVVCKADNAQGPTCTASQNDCEPSLVASHMSAASGRPTKTMRKVVTKPRDRAVAALSLETRALRGPLTATSVSRCSRRRSSGSAP